MEEISILVNVLRTPDSIHNKVGVEGEHTDPDKGGIGRVTPLFLPFPWFVHGSFVPRFRFLFSFWISRV